jgi:hypothetical protein
MDGPLLSWAVAVSKFVVFVFTDRRGIILLCLVLFGLLGMRIVQAVKTRFLIRAAAGKKNGFLAGMEAALAEASAIGAWAAAHLPAILSGLAVLAIAVGLSGVVTRFDEFLDLQKKTREYSLVLKNIEGRSRVARVECLAREGGSSRLGIEYYSSAGGQKPVAREEILIKGKDIYFDAIVLNFAFSGIESGADRNIAIPFRLFSEEVAQADGARLAVMDKDGVPYFFERGEDELYGIAKEAFDSRLKELMEISKTDKGAMKAGIVRSLYGNAVHAKMEPKQSFIVWIEQSGGLTIKEEKAF